MIVMRGNYAGPKLSFISEISVALKFAKLLIAFSLLANAFKSRANWTALVRATDRSNDQRLAWFSRSLQNTGIRPHKFRRLSEILFIERPPDTRCLASRKYARSFISPEEGPEGGYGPDTVRTKL